MNPLHWLSGPSKVKSHASPRQNTTRIDVVKYNPSIRKVELSYSEITLTRKYLAPWKKDEVMQVWLIDATAKLPGEEAVTVSIAISRPYEDAMELAMLKIIDTVSRQRMAKLYAQLRQA